MIELDGDLLSVYGLQSLKYVLGIGGIDCFTIGFENPEQIDEVLDAIGTVCS